jgi:hypothetical protein
MIPEDIFLKIVRSAVKAPSSHNTQPWSFAKEAEGICIEPDFNRALPVADPEHRELLISLGCAVETAMIAAKFYGYNPIFCVESVGDNHKIRILLSKIEHVNQLDLYPYIKSRQTTRNLYKNASIAFEDIEKLRKTVTETGVNIHFYFGKNEIKQFSPYIAEANAIQMSNPEFIKELIKWMRFSEREAMENGDGLYSACIGIPSMGRMLGSFVLKNAITVNSENKRLLKQLECTSTIALFTTSANYTLDWVKTGMAFQRFALVSTQLGLNHSYFNSPCQIFQVKEKMINDLRLDGFPQLLIRLGYSQKMPFSFRRRIQNIIKH